MGRHSLVIDGKVRDIAFRNKYTIPNPVHGASNNYSLYVGDEYWGQVYNMHGSWTAVANKPGEMNLVEGFATRRDAGFYITKYMRSGEGQAVERLR